MFQDRSALTQKCIDVLRGINQQIEYPTLLRAIGVQKMPSGALASARRALEREQICFLTIRGFGLRRLSDSEKVASVEKHKRSIKNASKRGIRRLDAVSEFGKLPNIDQLSATISRTTFEAIRSHMRKPSVQQKAAPLPLPQLAVLK